MAKKRSNMGRWSLAKSNVLVINAKYRYILVQEGVQERGKKQCNIRDKDGKLW